ncbi:hypothetical protein U0E10_19315 [Burkholderia ubonensis]|uniref:hypothetical protein n=1 Tax=Burkholderia ubonensis TaxID=101571 RepID=UPI0012BA7FEF|nr:hypothetical protein [Burkholderia ubonensis]MDY7790056.1 hypothetical protein [Burkholderia ubonensis]
MTLLAVEEERSPRGSCEAGMSRRAARGDDAGPGLFPEWLGYSDRAQNELLRFLMVQCRQLDVMGRARLQGWFDGGSLIERTWSKVQRRCYRSRLPFGWGISVSARRCAVAPDCSGVTTASWASVGQVK